MASSKKKLEDVPGAFGRDLRHIKSSRSPYGGKNIAKKGGKKKK